MGSSNQILVNFSEILTKFLEILAKNLDNLKNIMGIWETLNRISEPFFGKFTKIYWNKM